MAKEKLDREWGQLHVQIEPEMFNKLKEDANRLGIGISALVRLFLEKSYVSPQLEFKHKQAKAG